MVIAAAFIVYGIFDGEINAVLSKATALCRECVGIG
ncbi:MAG: thioredoxin [Eubacteriales bacterium]|nr:thioredoxin [Eubacteriales bacterium]